MKVYKQSARLMQPRAMHLSIEESIHTQVSLLDLKLGPQCVKIRHITKMLTLRFDQSMIEPVHKATDAEKALASYYTLEAL